MITSFFPENIQGGNGEQKMKTMRNYSCATYIAKRYRRVDVMFSPFSIASSCSFNLSEVEFFFFFFPVNPYHGHFRRNSTEDLQRRTGAT